MAFKQKNKRTIHNKEDELNQPMIYPVKKPVKIVFTNLKGGTGKTMCVYQIGAFLSERGYKVLMIDLDPQGNLTRAFLSKRPTPNLYNLLNKEAKFEDTIVQPYPKTPELKNIYLLPSNYDLFLFRENADTTHIKNILQMIMKNNLSGKYPIELLQDLMSEVLSYDVSSTYTINSLKDILSPYNKLFDFVLIDTHPSLNLTNLNAFNYADYIIPILDASIDAIEGFEYLKRTAIKTVKENTNPDLDILGVIVNHTDSRYNITKEQKVILKDLYADLLFDLYIPMTVRLQESRANRTPILIYEPSNGVNAVYAELTTEILKRLELKQEV